MREREEKRKPHPSRLRGRGVEVSKKLFYHFLCKRPHDFVRMVMGLL